MVAGQTKREEKNGEPSEGSMKRRDDEKCRSSNLEKVLENGFCEKRSICDRRTEGSSDMNLQ